MHNQAFSVEVVNTYRAWDEFSRRGDRDNDDKRIVDMDVAPPYPNPLYFDSSEQIVDSLEQLFDRAPKSGDYADFTVAKLRASLLHLRLLAGEKVTLREHVGTAMGVASEQVDEELIDERRTRLDDQLKQHGLRFDREYEDAMVVDGDVDALRQRVIGLGERAKAVTGQFVSDEGIPDIQPEIVSKDEPWVGQASTRGPGKFFEEINVHPRHKHTIGRLAAITIHEIQGHITQFSIWQDKIVAGEMDPTMGVTTMHTPENTQAEFNALTIEQIGLLALAAADPEDGWRYEFQAGYHDLLSMVQHNVHFRTNSGYPDDKVAEYAADRLPFTSLEDIKKGIAPLRKNPMVRGYQGCYEPAQAAGRLLLARPQAAQQAVLRETFARPMTLPQIEDLAKAS